MGGSGSADTNRPGGGIGAPIGYSRSAHSNWSRGLAGLTLLLIVAAALHAPQADRRTCRSCRCRRKKSRLSRDFSSPHLLALPPAAPSGSAPAAQATLCYSTSSRKSSSRLKVEAPALSPKANMQIETGSEAVLKRALNQNNRPMRLRSLAAGIASSTPLGRIPLMEDLFLLPSGNPRLGIRNVGKRLRIAIRQRKPRALHLHHDAVAAAEGVKNIGHRKVDIRLCQASMAQASPGPVRRISARNGSAA